MKIVFNREQFLAAFSVASSVAPKNSPKPILASVKLSASSGQAVLQATDLEIGIRINVPGIEVTNSGSVILPPLRFGSILRESKDETLTLSTDGNKIVIRGEKSEYNLPASNPADFPTVPDFAETSFHDVPAAALRQAIRRTVYATDSESQRFALGGVLLEFLEGKIIAVSTDGRRLAKMEVAGTGKQAANVIVPAKAMQLISQSLTDCTGDVQLVARNSDVLLRTDKLSIYTRLVEGRFPQWRNVIPNRSSTKVELHAGTLASAVRQAAIVTSEESKGVYFDFSADNLTLKARAADVGESEVYSAITYDAPPIGITLDPRFVVEFLRVLDQDEKFTLDIKDAESAAVCRCDDGYEYVIMPLARDR